MTPALNKQEHLEGPPSSQVGKRCQNCRNLSVSRRLDPFSYPVRDNRQRHVFKLCFNNHHRHVFLALRIPTKAATIDVLLTLANCGQ